jgi:chemotaxis protein methyltransferase CheR
MIPSDQDFEAVSNTVKALCGLSLGHDKKYLIQSRLEPLLHKYGLKSYADLSKLCNQPGQAPLRNEVVEAMTTRETSFHRDAHPFRTIKMHLIPQLVLGLQSRSIVSRKQIKIWSAAASTGQEAYSLAMLVTDFCDQSNAARPSKISPGDFQILATDISQQCLATARQGCYAEWEIRRGLNTQQIEKHFIKKGDRFQIHQSLQKMVDFRWANLLESKKQFREMDLILCRNVLIYFDEPTRQQILLQLAECLQPGGFLILGAAETTLRNPPGLERLNFGPTAVFRRVTSQPINA